jgi:THO complex subunit 2
MLKQLPYERRYELYGRWKNRSYGIYPELMEARTQTLSQGRYIMKRLTKDNVKPSGRMIGKLSHSNPGIIFEYVLSQIQRYDNFIIPVVDALKYLTPMAYDVLAYVVIEALGHPQKERLKHEDTNISNWLQGLANFSANVFKKYPIELTGLLQYVANQLKAAKSFDLLVLKEVVQKMSGIENSDEITQSQLEALAGGELLKAEGAYFSQVRNTKKSSHRLREALLEADLSLPLCLLMAQQRDGIIYREGANRHLKLVCNLYDNCLDTLVQFGGFLSTHLNPDDYNYKVPPLDVLGLEYHVPADAAFFMLRPLIKSSINESFEAEKAEKDKVGLSKQAKASAQEASYHSAWYSVLDRVVEAARQLHTPKVWEDMSPKLYTTFWVLSLYDLYVPTGRYEDEVRKAREAIKDIDDKSDMTSSKRKKEQERSVALIEKLQEEKQRQEDNHRLVNSCIKQEKDSWFTAKVTKNRTITQFLQLCIFPRCRFTATDAIFCAKFVYMLHTQQTPNFSTLLFLDRTFSDISYSVACCTENEVRRYGRFLGAILEIVSKWHAAETLYEQECARTPGFISMMRSSAGGAEKMQYLDYENYRHITFKWHFKLTKALVVLLESKDYMQVRNGLIVLTKVLPYYPKVYHLSIALEKRVEKIMEEEKEKRADLYALAIGYAGMLKLHKQNLVPEADFHIREERVKAQKTEGEASTSAKPASTPAPPTAATEKTTKKEKEATREKGEKAAASKPEEKPPQKITKVKGALTATEARAAAEKEKEQLASTKEKGEESKSPESASEAVAASATSELQQPSTPNPELPAASAARREAKTGGNGVAATSSSASKTAKTKTKEAVSSTATAENGGNNNHHQVKKSAKSMGKSTEEESGSGDSSSEKKTTSKGSGKADDKTPKGKPKSLLDKPDGAATPSSRGASPSNAPSPVMRGARGTKNSPVVNQNGPTTTATPSPRAGQRRQLSENEITETIPEKEMKRRKIEEKAKADDASSKEKDAEKRKRERSSDKEASTSEAKRRKDSPRDDSSTSSSPQPDSKRRLVKVSSKKDVTSKLQETKRLKQEAVPKVAVKKEKEEKLKKHVGRPVKKEKT